MNYIPIAWINDYITHIKYLEYEYCDEDGYCCDINDFVKSKIEDMLDEYADEVDDRYILCEIKTEVVERKPNGEMITRERYVPVGEE